MTAPKNEPPKDGQSTKDTGKTTAGDVRGWIREEIGNILPSLLPKSTEDSSKTPAPQGNQPVDVKGEVALALQQLKTREDRLDRDRRVDAMLTEYEKPKVEEPPVERRRIEKFMHWSD